MKTYFTGAVAARRPVTICTGVIATLISIVFAVMWIPQMFINPWTPSHLMGTMCATIFIGAPLSLGVFLLTKIVKNERTLLAITTEGIEYGSSVFGWDEVEVLGIMKRYVGRRDLFCEVRSRPYRVELPLSKGLNDEEIASLLGALKAEVLAQHPSIEIVEGTE
jgi:hypothetical protein